MTFGLLDVRDSRCSASPKVEREIALFSHAGSAVLPSIFLVMVIVPYFMTGFESVAKIREEAGFDPEFPARFTPRSSPGFFYAHHRCRHARVSPAGNRVGARVPKCFERTFGSHAIAQLILFARSCH
jgi:hypothetical protein